MRHGNDGVSLNCLALRKVFERDVKNAFSRTSLAEVALVDDDRRYCVSCATSSRRSQPAGRSVLCTEPVDDAEEPSDFERLAGNLYGDASSCDGKSQVHQGNNERNTECQSESK